MANKRSAASSRGRDLFRAEVSSLLADLGELAGEQGPHPVLAATPPVTAEPAAEALEPVVHGTGSDAAPAPGPAGEAEEPPAPPELDEAPDEELISLSPSYLPPLPPASGPSCRTCRRQPVAGTSGRSGAQRPTRRPPRPSPRRSRSNGSPRLRTHRPPPGRDGLRRRGTRTPLRRPEADGPCPRDLRRRWSGRRQLGGHPRRACPGRQCRPPTTITRPRNLRCGRRRRSCHPWRGATIASVGQLRPRRPLLRRPNRLAAVRPRSATRSSPPVTSRPRSSRSRIRAHRYGAALRRHHPRVSPRRRSCPAGGWTGRSIGRGPSRARAAAPGPTAPSGSAPPRRRSLRQAGRATARRATRRRRASPVFPSKQ